MAISKQTPDQCHAPSKDTPSHRKNAKIYFIPNTIKLHPKYQHLAQKFASLLKNIHTAHGLYTNTFPYISLFLQQQYARPPPHLLYAIIITIHPSVEECNRILSIQDPCPTNWTIILLDKVNTLHNPLERHIRTKHLYQKLLDDNQELIIH